MKTFLDLVKIDSPSGEEKIIAIEVSKRLKKLGGNVEFDSFGNCIAKFPGRGEPFLLNAHLDTVEPGRGIKPMIKGNKITSDGTTILGADPKAGVAAILEALTSLAEDKVNHQPIEVVFTKEEETGLCGAVNLDYSIITARHGVTFDGEDGVNNICISAPGYSKVDVTITGKGAHAGAEPEKGLSAIYIASLIISQLHLGRIDEETTANIGQIMGGTARNAVPSLTLFKGEIRSRNPEKLKKHTQHFQHILQRVQKQFSDSKLKMVIKKEFDSYILKEDHKVITKAKKIYKKLGLIPNLCHSGGATDVNIFHTHGIGAVVVGAGFYNAHTVEEYVLISEMLQTAQFCQELVTSPLI